MTKATDRAAVLLSLLKAVAEAHALPQYELCARAHMPQSHWSAVLNGSMPRLDTLLRITEVLGYDLVLQKRAIDLSKNQACE